MEPVSDVSRAAAYWDREHQEPCADWMFDPLVRRYINSHFENDWPLQWFVKWLDGRRFGRALSIGCGTGGLERTLIERNTCDRIDAFDASLQSVVSARRDAEAAGLGARIRYFVADFNRPAFPHRAYDAVFVHQSLHHVERLESLFAAVLSTVKPEGLLFLDEYIGPSRIDWTRKLLTDATRVHAAFADEYRVHSELLYPINAIDPSEAMRSSEIRGLLAAGFRTIELRGYGGNILAILYPEVRWDRAPAVLMDRLIEKDEDLARRCGPYYAVMIARPRGRFARLFAATWYTWGATWLRYRWRRAIRPLLLRLKLGILRRLGQDARW